MIDALLDQVRVEIKLLERLLAEYEDLLRRAQQAPPNRVEITAIAAVLHAFYNGLENVFQIIAKNLDQQIPAGHKWHLELLDRMAYATEHRPALLSAETALLLKEYLSFRHFFRHSYSFFLAWNKFGNLAQSLPAVWQQVKSDLEVFLQAFETASE